MKKLSLLFASCLAIGCTSDDIIETVISEPSLKGIVMTIPDYKYNEENTRTTITPTNTGMSFSWKEGDKVGIYASSSMANFDIDEISQDTKSATFDGGGFSLTEGSTYHAFYPYNGYATDKTQIPVTYFGQVQAENGSSSHLGIRDYMTATTTATGTNEAQFNFIHLGAIMRFKITVPIAQTYTHLTLTSSGNEFTIDGVVDLTSETPVIKSTKKDSRCCLKLGNDGISIYEDNLVLTVYLITPPVDLSNDIISVCLRSYGETEYTGAVQGKNMVAGGAYAYSTTVQVHQEVDLGLSVKWAWTNVDATRPEEYGGWYSWGETVMKATNKGWSTYSLCNGTHDTQKKYCTNYLYGTVDNKSTLEAKDDVASLKWGGTWRMPTSAERTELYENCYWQWTNSYNGTGVKGYIVYKAKVDADKGFVKNNNSTSYPSASYSLSDRHIFLPAGGSRDYTGTFAIGSSFVYWTSSLNTFNNTIAYSFSGGSGGLDRSGRNRYVECRIRPVCP